MRGIDATGHKYNMLTCIESTRDERGRKVWKCLCDCGNICYRQLSYIRANEAKSCGCSRYKYPKYCTGLTTVIAQYRVSCRRRNLYFGLNVDEFYELTQQNCFYCGVEPLQQQHRDKEFIYNGIDRVDSSKGYTIDNCVACCGRCNTAKNDMTLEEFKDWIGKVYRNTVGV